MTLSPPDEIEISRSATLGALFSVLGEILFGLALLSLALRSVLPHSADPLGERISLYVAGGFVSVGWLLLRGRPRGGALRIPGGAPAVKRLLSDVFYPAFAMFAVFCISLVAIMLIAALLCALLFSR